jgi:hypothetical protein
MQLSLIFATQFEEFQRRKIPKEYQRKNLEFGI